MNVTRQKIATRTRAAYCLIGEKLVVSLGLRVKGLHVLGLDVIGLRVFRLRVIGQHA